MRTRTECVPQEIQAKKLEAVVGWVYRTSGFTRLEALPPNGVAPPSGDFGWCVLTAENARLETGDTVYLYREGRIFEIDKRSQRVRTLEDEEHSPFPFTAETEEGPWLGALLANKVGALNRRIGQERIGALRCTLIEWRNTHFMERRWRFRLGEVWIPIRYEVFYKDRTEGFVVLSGMLEPRIERVSPMLFTLPSK